MIVIESLNHIGLTVSNLENSVKFYKDMFDFEVLEQISNSGRALLSMGDIILVLQESSSFKAPDSAKTCLSFFVDEQDFDDAVDELEEKGLAILRGPENIRNGQLVVFADPDGNPIELSYPETVKK